MKKKICFITLFIVLFAFIIGCKSFASSNINSFIYNGKYYFIPEDLVDKFSNFYFIRIDDSYYFFANNDDFGIQNYYNSSINNYFYFPVNSDFAFSLAKSDIDSCLNDYKIKSEISGYGVFCYEFEPANSSFDNNMSLIFSNSPIYLYDIGNGFSHDVILASPTSSYSSSLVSSNSVSGTLNSNMLSNVLNEIVTLLPIVIPVLIGFIAIRKGLAFIFRILRKS